MNHFIHHICSAKGLMKFFSFILLLFCSLNIGYSQSTNSDHAPFDVSFWRKELRLNRTQLAELDAINQNMYHSIYELAKSKSADRVNFPTVLKTWRVSTFEVLTTKQRRKWKKLLINYAHAGSASSNRAG